MNSTLGLAVEQIHVWRGDLHVLQGVSLQAVPGELLQIRGPNGTGKTTLLRVICGLLRPERGTVSWRGRSIVEHRVEYQADLAYASHEAALKSDLTALENLQFTVGLKRRVRALELQDSLERMGVAACAELPARVLSAGQRRRIAMARVLATRAPLWVLDEPFSNLDTAGVELLSQVLSLHVQQGGVALVVAHHELAVDCRCRQLGLGACA